jgi:hypothetical protein
VKKKIRTDMYLRLLVALLSPKVSSRSISQ